MKRGEIYYVHLSAEDVVGSEQRAGRPAIIVSNDLNNEHSGTVEIVYMTTQHKPDLPTHVAINSTGRPSTALCEQIHTVSKQRIGNYAGTCTRQEMEIVNIALLVSLGLEMPSEEEQEQEQDEEAPVVELTADVSELLKYPTEMVKLETEKAVYKDMCELLLDKMIARGAT